MITAVTGLLALSPLLILLASLWRAIVLFWPTMILVGAVHNDVFDWVPALSAWQTFLVVALLGLLIPTGTTATAK